MLASQRLAGIRGYKMIQIWSDFVFQISYLASFLKNSSSEHFSSMKYLIHYLCRTADYHIIYDRINEKSADLVDYSDSNFNICRVTRWSTDKYIFMLNRNSISWSSKKQSTMTLSITETEYYALSQIIKKISWLWKLLVSLKIYNFDSSTSILINMNSTDIIKTKQNLIENDHTKHFNIHYHFVQDEISTDCIQLTYILIKNNLTNSLTKSLAKIAYKHFVKNLRLRSNWSLIKTSYIHFCSHFDSCSWEEVLILHSQLL